MKNKETFASCPSLLKHGIEMANFVPSQQTFSMQYSNTYVEQYFRDLTGEELPRKFISILDEPHLENLTEEEEEICFRALEMALRRIEKEVKKFPKFYSYLFDDPKPPDNWQIVDGKLIRMPPIYMYGEKNGIFSAFNSRVAVLITLGKYNEVLYWKDNLRGLVKDCQRYQRTGKLKYSNHIIPRIIDEQDTDLIIHYYIDEVGKISFGNSDFIKALSGADAARLKICPICDDIFWARRIEAQTCSTKQCSNNFHQRNLRIKEYEKRFDKESKSLKKLQTTLSAENGLIAQQTARVDKLREKIKKEKMKNGTL